MAGSKNPKKVAEDFDQEIEVLQDKLNNIASLLGDSLRNKMSDLTTETQNFVDSFSKGEDVGKEINKKLITLQKETNRLSLEKIKLESDLVKAQQTSNGSFEKRIKKALLQNKLATEYNESHQTLLIRLKQASEEEKHITEEKQKQNSLLEEARKLLNSQYVDQIKNLFTVAGILKAILDGALRFNKTSVEISKNIGYGAEKANAMALKMEGIAASSGNINVTMKSLGQAMNELNAATGGVADYSADTLETQVMLTKQFGLTAEEAAGIYKFSVLTGKSSSQVNKEMVAAFANTRNAVKGSADFKKTMAEASKVSGQLATQFKNNPALITAAIVKMQALGTTLEQTKKQGDALLNFEESLEAELKAELLTGKQLNLEKARAAALAGDQVTLAEELAKNVGTLEDFQKMGPLQQKAMAEAMGMTTDEMAEQLRKQKIAQEQGKSLAQVNAEEAEKAQKRQDLQDRFNALMEKLMDIIGKIGVALQPVINLFMWLTDHTWALYTVLGLIALSRLPAMAKYFKDMGSSLKNMVTNVKDIFSKKGLASAVGGAAGGGDELEKAKKAADDAKKVGGGGGGVGKGIKDTLTGISKGIQSFSKVSVADIGKLALSAIALVLMTPAVPALLLLQFVNGKAIEKALEGTGKGIAKFTQNIDLKSAAKAALAIGLLGISIIPAALAFQMFADVSWEDLAKAGVTLIGLGIAGSIMGDMATEMIKGAFAIAVLGLSLIPATIALKMFAEVGWDDLAKAGVTLLALGIAGAAFGALMPLMLMGAIAIGALGLALLPFAYALNLMSESMPKLSEMMTTLGSVPVGNLLAIGPALILIAAGLAALGVGQAVGAIGSAIGGAISSVTNFLGLTSEEETMGPIEKIQALAAAGPGIQTTANALAGIASSLDTVVSALDSLDIGKLFALENFIITLFSAGAVGVLSGIVEPINAVVNASNKVAEQNKPIIDALHEVRDSVNKLYNKEIIIKLDGKTIGTSLTQGSTKAA